MDKLKADLFDKCKAQCDLVIEQAITEGHREGLSDYSIGLDTAKWIADHLHISVNPGTIAKRGGRIRREENSDNVAKATPQKSKVDSHTSDPHHHLIPEEIIKAINYWDRWHKLIINDQHCINNLTYSWYHATEEAKLLFLDCGKRLNPDLLSKVAAHSDRGKDVLDKMQKYVATSGECPNRKDDTCPWVEELQAWADYLDSWEMDLQEREQSVAHEEDEVADVKSKLPL